MDLEVSLPRGDWKLYAVKSIPKRTRRLVYSSKRDPQDVLTHYTFLLQQTVFVLGLELAVYESNSYTTLFISKADTSGYSRVNAGPVVAGIVARVLGTFNSQKPVRICLSAKSQPQYLFPNSKENSQKHVLTDSQLISWWTKTLDRCCTILKSPKAKLHIPGMSSHETAGYLPSPNWSPGDIFSRQDQWAVKCIPRFDDDPKTRFLDDIVRTKRAKTVDCTQFWFELADRQECNINSRLGFIGIEAHGVLETCPRPFEANAFNYSQYRKIKQVLMSGDYSSHDSAKQSSETLETHLPEPLEISGVWVPPVKQVETQKRQINSLQGLVRKKRKV